MIKGQNIICISSANWDDRSWVNVQHIMSRLAHNNKILYIDSIGLRKPNIARKNDFSRVIRRIMNFLKGLRMVRNNLYLFSPIILPLHHIGFVRMINCLILSVFIKLFKLILNFKSPILWIFLPTASCLAQKVKNRLTIYHCVDEYAENPLVKRNAIMEMEDELIKRADIVITTSKPLYESKKIKNINTYLLTNVADCGSFISYKGSISDKLKSINHPLIGFVGNITAYKVDLALLEFLAMERTDWNIVLVGPVGRGDPNTNVDRLRRIDNIHFIGEVRNNLLPSYVKAFDVCLIPFKVNETTRNSLPLKFFEYLACGKPVVSTVIDSLKEFGDYCKLADNREEYLISIESFLRNDSEEEQDRRIDFAKKNSWDIRMEEISEVIEEHLHRSSE